LKSYRSNRFRTCPVTQLQDDPQQYLPTFVINMNTGKRMPNVRTARRKANKEATKY